MTKSIKPKITLSNPIHLVAVGFGSGLLPKSPGTFGSLAAIPIWWLFHDVASIYYWTIVMVAAVLGCWFCDKTAKDINVHDDGRIVWDEFVGMWITLFFIVSVSWLSVFIAFFWFRIFDILKPWPIRWFDQKANGGFGIMIDDVVAAIFAAVAVCITQIYI